MQGTPEVALDDEGEDEEVRQRRRKRRRRVTIFALLLSLFYYCMAMAYFTQRAVKPCLVQPETNESLCLPTCFESWSAGDAVYFATVTMTTVGYGDLKPGSTENQLLTIFFILFGVIVRGPSDGRAAAPPAPHARARQPPRVPCLPLSLGVPPAA